MKVLKNNYNEANIKKEVKQVKPYPRTCLCEECHSELEYEESDLRIGELGLVFLDCPLCGKDNALDDNENSITLTMDNVEFPVHFHHISTETGAVDICNNEKIKERIQKAINYFRQNKEEFVWTGESGNLYVAVYRYSGDEDYYVVVSNNYYSTYIDFESEDYGVSF